MKNPFKHLKHTGLFLFLFAICSYPAFAFEPQAVVLPRVEVIIPGVTRTITVEQNDVCPEGIDKMVIVAIGYGGVEIQMTQPPETAQENNFLRLNAVGISSAGIVPVRKFGKTVGTLTASIATGDERLPFGIVWVSSWVSSSENDPPFEYQLVITTSLDLYSEF